MSGELQSGNEPNVAGGLEKINPTDDFERLSRDYPAFFARGVEIGSCAVGSYKPEVPGRALSESDEVVKYAMRSRHNGQPVESRDLWRLRFDSEESLAISAGIFAGSLNALVARGANLREEQG